LAYSNRASNTLVSRAELAAWVLRDKPEWNVERAQAAMTSGKDNLQVNLTAIRLATPMRWLLWCTRPRYVLRSVCARCLHGSERYGSRCERTLL
jgi:hypothetical protein